MTPPALPRLLLVTDRRRTSGRPLVDVVALAVEAGVRFVQIRERDLDDLELSDLVERLVRRVPEETRITVNSALAIARTFGLGLHLPAGAPVPDLAGIPFWGRSVHGRAELLQALAAGASYAILGTIFPTASKPGVPGRGIPWLRELGLARIETPVFAIGGIDAGRAAQARDVGVHGVAVCGAILAAPDPRSAVTALLDALRGPAESHSKAQ